MMLKEDEAVQSYLHERQDNIQAAFNDLTEMIDGLEDVDDKWKANISEINKRIKEAAVRNGITKESKFKFKEF